MSTLTWKGPTEAHPYGKAEHIDFGHGCGGVFVILKLLRGYRLVIDNGITVTRFDFKTTKEAKSFANTFAKHFWSSTKK